MVPPKLKVVFAGHCVFGSVTVISTDCPGDNVPLAGEKITPLIVSLKTDQFPVDGLFEGSLNVMVQVKQPLVKLPGLAVNVATAVHLQDIFTVFAGLVNVIFPVAGQDI